MASIQSIDATKPISLAPAIINQNFQNINTELGGIAGILKVATKSLELNGKITAPANSVEAFSVIATGNSGVLFKALVDGITDVFSVDVNGHIIGKKVTLDPAQSSAFGEGTFFGTVLMKEKVSFEKDLALIGTGVLIDKYSFVTVLPSNIGSSATAPLNVSDKREVFLDASNGGAQFVAPAADALLKLDVASLKLGQKIWLRLSRKNSTNELKLWNGDSSASLFAKFDMTNGVTDIAYTVYPTFDSTAGASHLLVQYVQVSAGINRLLILESSGVTNI